MTSKVCAIVGVGPALGAALGRRFAKEGFSIALLARDADRLKTLSEEISSKFNVKAIGISCDATEESSVNSAFESVKEQLGAVPTVAIYNAGSFALKSVENTNADEFLENWKSNCFGGFLMTKAVLKDMIARGSGTILFTGATAGLRGSAMFANLAVGKFGLRALAQSLARENGPKNIHVAYVVVDGVIDAPKTRQMLPDRPTESFLNPEAIAEQYWNLHSQHPSTWTFELDLRPNIEKW